MIPTYRNVPGPVFFGAIVLALAVMLLPDGWPRYVGAALALALIMVAPVVTRRLRRTPVQTIDYEKRS